MKKVILFVGVILFPHFLLAEKFIVIGDIENIGSIVSRDDGDFMMMEVSSSTGSCPKSENLVVARFPSGDSGARAYALALAAKLAGKKVRLALDEDFKNSNGFCNVNSIQLSE